MSFAKCSIALCVLFSACVFVGCNSGPKLPPEIPGVSPCLLTFTQENSPLADATVILRGDYTWTVAGTTDANGVAKLKTNGLFDGVPPGSYKVIVTKIETEADPNESAPQAGEPGYEEWLSKRDRHVGPASHSLVEKQYTSAETTPLTIEVSDKEVKSEFDLGKKVREKI